MNIKRKEKGLTPAIPKLHKQGPDIYKTAQIKPENNLDPKEAAKLMNLEGNATSLKLLYLLDNMKESHVCDLAELLGVSVSEVSQHLTKLRALGLVAPHRDAQTIYYRLTDHAFNDKLREKSLLGSVF